MLPISDPQVPIPLPVKRQQFLAIKWLIHAARARKGHGMPNRLAIELLDAYNNQVFDRVFQTMRFSYTCGLLWLLLVDHMWIYSLFCTCWQGVVIKKKQDLHRLAEANRAYAHFRWWILCMSVHSCSSLYMQNDIKICIYFSSKSCEVERLSHGDHVSWILTCIHTGEGKD